jgi:hypothetical protein
MFQNLSIAIHAPPDCCAVDVKKKLNKIKEIMRKIFLHSTDLEISFRPILQRLGDIEDNRSGGRVMEGGFRKREKKLLKTLSTEWDKLI